MRDEHKRDNLERPIADRGPTVADGASQSYADFCPFLSLFELASQWYCSPAFYRSSASSPLIAEDYENRGKPMLAPAVVEGGLGSGVTFVGEPKRPTQRAPAAQGPHSLARAR